MSVFVWTVALLLPLPARRKQLGVVRHVEFSGVPDIPAIRRFVTKQNAVRVELPDDLQVSGSANLKNRT